MNQHNLLWTAGCLCIFGSSHSPGEHRGRALFSSNQSAFSESTSLIGKVPTFWNFKRPIIVTFSVLSRSGTVVCGRADNQQFMLHLICGFSGMSCKAKDKILKFAVGENKTFIHRLRWKCQMWIRRKSSSHLAFFLKPETFCHTVIS